MTAVATTLFEQWATSRQYDTARAVLPAANRIYADRQTQDVYDAWSASRSDADATRRAGIARARGASSARARSIPVIFHLRRPPLAGLSTLPCGRSAE